MHYNNYHKHSHKSNIFTPDTHIKIESYMKRMKELGHTTFFTGEHGYGGDIFESKKYCSEYGFKCVFSIEAYCVPDSSIKDDSNYHIVLIAKTNESRKKLNLLNSIANKNGYYYRPRIDVKGLLTLKPDDIFITTSCVAGIIRDKNSFVNIFLPLYRHFKDNILIETQSHIHPKQIEHNIRAVQIAEIYNLKLCHGNDSHYIYPSDAKDRQIFLNGKKTNYGDEDSFILDYPSYDEIIDRYLEQGVLTREKAIEAIKNTCLFDICEDIDINKDIKMPSIYPTLDINQKHEKLYDIILKKFNLIKNEIDTSRLNEYYNAIDYEFKIIKETGEVRTVDYFLLNERIIDIGINKYKGVLTKTGRGSNVAFFINRLLGFTEIDRMTSEIPLYPDRFMSKSRILESHSMPDCDFNTMSPYPFISATKEILGEDNCYWMIAYGTMQEGEAFRNLCRSYDLNYDEYNEVAKNIDSFRDDEYWGKLIKESEKFIGVIVSASPHPCANLLMDKPISEEIGIVKIGSEFCVVIDSDQADEWKYLKNDYLTVSVLSIIYETFRTIKQPMLSTKELKNKLDTKVWQLYEKGLTATLNQVDGDWTTELVQKFKPKTIGEFAMFTSAIRPSFKSWRDIFIDRIPYSTGTPQLDNLFESTKHFILFQENLMQFLTWLGIETDKTITIIKRISKKKITSEEFAELENTLRTNWIRQVGNDEKFNETWEHVQSCLEYGYNSPHALAMTYDSLYCAYLKANYPIEYYTVVLNLFLDDSDKTARIIHELPYFDIQVKPIQFRFSTSEYNYDKSTNTIFKGIKSIKYMNEQIANELFELGKNQYKTFVELLVDIEEKTTVNTKQMTILIILDFFREFGKNKKLMKIYDEFTNGKYRYDKKHVEKTKIKRKHELIESIENVITNEEFTPDERIKAEILYLGYAETIAPQLSEDYYICIDLMTKYRNPIVTLYRLKDGKKELYKIKKDIFEENKLEVFTIIKPTKKKQDYKWKKTDRGFQKSNEKEWYLLSWNTVK